jgi:hypothetical protein
LDATAMRADGGFVRLRGATSRSAVASPGGGSILFAWTEANAVVRYSVLEW